MRFTIPCLVLFVCTWAIYPLTGSSRDESSNNTSTIGLYQGMFEKNSLTYNPGWDRDCKTLSEFQDVREIQHELRKRGLNPVVAADESTSGPAFLTLVDPDGNPILIDQHVPKPTKKQ